MTILLLKILLAPLMIGFASFIGKAFGPSVGGFVVGLPLTSGPIVLILSLEHGQAFARVAAAGILSGVISVVAFCITYSHLCKRTNWLWSELGSITVYLIATYVMELWSPSLLYTSISVIAVLTIAAYLLHTGSVAHHLKASSPNWDLPVRMFVATAFVFLLTSIAQSLGPHLSGLLAPFPIFVSVLVIFTHIFEGSGSAERLLYGVILGLFSFAIFFISITMFIRPFGILFAFTVAIVSALGTQGTLLILKRLCNI
jgi:hypothetical protein